MTMPAWSLVRFLLRAGQAEPITHLIDEQFSAMCHVDAFNTLLYLMVYRSWCPSVRQDLIKFECLYILYLTIKYYI